jgi:hypothetical protein
MESGAGNDRNLVAGIFVLAQKLTDFHLDELDELGAVRRIELVDLVEKHDDVRHVNLTGKKNVLLRLGHGTVGGRDHENGCVHLGGARDHVLDVVGMARAVYMGVVPVFGFIFLVRRGNRYPARLFFGSVIDLVIVDRFILSANRRGKTLGNG